MAPRTTRKATAAAARTGPSAQEKRVKNESDVQAATLRATEELQAKSGEDDAQTSGGNPVIEARKKSTPATLPASLNLGSTSIKFTTFTVASAGPPKSGKSGKETTCRRSHPAPHPTSLIFTHGAGGDLSAPAMVNFSQGFASTDSSGVVMFQGNMNVKARAGLFGRVKEYEIENGSLARTVDRSLTGDNDPGNGGGKGKGSAKGKGPAAGKKRKIEGQQASLAFGGRSMGARAAVIASHTDSEVEALVLASYPLVGPSGDIRDKILLDVDEDVDVLFISGDNDNMCPLERLQSVREKMKAKTWRVTVEGADHGMNVRGGKRLKEGTERLGKECGRVAAEWLRDRDPEKTEMSIRWDGDTGRVVGRIWVGAGMEAKETPVKAPKKENDNAADEAREDEDEGGRGKRRKTTKK